MVMLTIALVNYGRERKFITKRGLLRSVGYPMHTPAQPAPSPVSTYRLSEGGAPLVDFVALREEGRMS